MRIEEMRTTLDIPQDLLEEAQDRLGVNSATATVVFALRDLVRRGRVEELKSLLGDIHLDVDIEESRRRRA